MFLIFCIILSRPCFPLTIDIGNIECSIHLYSSPWLGLVTVCLFTLGTSIDYGKCINHLLLDGYLTTHTFTNVLIHRTTQINCPLMKSEDPLEFIGTNLYS